MLEIPGELMMTPVAAFSDPLIGDVLLSHRDMVRGGALFVYTVVCVSSCSSDVLIHICLRRGGAAVCVSQETCC